MKIVNMFRVGIPPPQPILPISLFGFSLLLLLFLLLFLLLLLEFIIIIIMSS